MVFKCPSPAARRITQLRPSSLRDPLGKCLITGDLQSPFFPHPQPSQPSVRVGTWESGLEVGRVRESRKRGGGRWELGAGSWEPGKGNREQEAGNREQGTGIREQGEE